MSPQLQPNELRRSVDLTTFDFQTTADLQAETSIIGQPRGVMAIEFGIDMQSQGYNIYVLGESGTGRTTAIQRFVESRAAGQPVPSDWVYAHNFADPRRPLALELAAGRGIQLRDALETLIRRLRGDVSRAFDNQAFRDATLEIQHDLDAGREKLFSDLQERAVALGAALLASPEGFRIVPAAEGKPLSAEQFGALSEEQREQWKKTNHRLQHDLNETVHQARAMERESERKLAELIRRVASSVVDVALQELKEKFTDHDSVVAYLDQVHQDIIEHVDYFRTEVSDENDDDPESRRLDERFRRYQVNVFVDHSESNGAPVIVEYDPTLPRLLGRVEHEARKGGAVVTDFTLLRPGALHAANGGYLVLRARDLFSEYLAWDSLKRTLIGEAVRPDDPAVRGGAPTRSLDPEPIPLDVKVILTGPPALYYFLHEVDEDFRELFKVMADFDEVVERDGANERDYAKFIATRCHEESLLHLDRRAVARVIEYGSRLAGTQNKLSTRFGAIADLIRESHFIAAAAGRDMVTVDNVERAIDNRYFLRNRIETRLRERLMTGKQLVATEGETVGQINGLSVSQVGDHAFGHPTRVTARTYVGKQGVVQIDREVELAGPIHNKGLMTLVGYLGGQYAGDQPLSLSAQITFEQNYGGIEGDSASSTELYALLSSLAQMPIKQDIAVTGSVNQRGDIQAIGGVTQKVEGWYSVCLERGLTGNQGVIIPVSNVSDLMLRVAVVQAVEEGKFHLWSVASVDEGIEILTGVPAADVHAAAKARLRELAGTMREFDRLA